VIFLICYNCNKHTKSIDVDGFYSYCSECGVVKDIELEKLPYGTFLIETEQEVIALNKERAIIFSFSLRKWAKDIQIGFYTFRRDVDRYTENIIKVWSGSFQYFSCQNARFIQFIESIIREFRGSYCE